MMPERTSAGPVVASPGGPSSVPNLSPEVRRWLHDKYERLAEAEGQLAASRTSYFAAIGAVLITGLFLVMINFLSAHAILELVTTFVASLGMMISLVWLILLHRTIDAQNLWRAGAIALEELTPPIDGTLPANIRLRSGEPMEVDLLKPYQAHARRFSNDPRVSWMDRMTPDALTQILPFSFLVIWAGVLISVWIYVNL